MTAIPHRDADVYREGTTVHTPAYQAYRILQIAFVAAPILAGIDKFFNSMVRDGWEKYLWGGVPQMLHIKAYQFMMIVGVIEIIAGIGVALKPKYFGFVVAGWMAAIIINLLLVGGYYDIALRDLGLGMAAFALGRMAMYYDQGPWGGLYTRPEHMPPVRA